MLKIHKPFSKHKLFLISVTSICITFGLLGFYYLTYTPELSHAETVIYPEKETRTMDDITYMQDITPEICTNTPEADAEGNYQYQLIDKRDSKTYWVAKLKDGNCWMTQNLGLDLDTNKTFTSEDTDINSGWTANQSTQYSLSEWIDSESFQESYSPGEYIYTMPLTYSDCGVGNTIGLSSCSGWEKVDGLSKDRNADKRAHYLSGNYYNYAAVSAGTDNEIIPNSICPAGWKLPMPGSSREDGTFYRLFASYKQLDNAIINYPIAYIGSNIMDAPFYFLYGGVVVSSGSLNRVGWLGYYWLSGSSNGENYILYISGNVFSPFVKANAYYGNAVRCFSSGMGKKDIEIIINPTISLDVVDEVMVEKNETNPSVADLEVKVTSNQKYSVGISATNPNLTSLTNNTTIPAKSGLLNTAENGWGIKLKDNTNYTALTTSLQTFYTASGAEIKTIPFTIGISTIPDLPNGEYSTNITVTATQN